MERELEQSVVGLLGQVKVGVELLRSHELLTCSDCSLMAFWYFQIVLHGCLDQALVVEADDLVDDLPLCFHPFE